MAYSVNGKYDVIRDRISDKSFNGSNNYIYVSSTVSQPMTLNIPDNLILWNEQSVLCKWMLTSISYYHIKSTASYVKNKWRSLKKMNTEF